MLRSIRMWQKCWSERSSIFGTATTKTFSIRGNLILAKPKGFSLACHVGCSVFGVGRSPSRFFFYNH